MSAQTPSTAPPSPRHPARYRPLTFGVTRVSLREGAPGVRYLQADQPLGAYARAHDRPPGALGARPRPTAASWRGASSSVAAARATGSM